MEIETIPVELFSFDYHGGYYQANVTHIGSALPSGPYGGFPSHFCIRFAGKLVEYQVEENLAAGTLSGVLYVPVDAGVAAMAVIWNR